nr:hypothetical protein GCM10010200_045190 [Actinomadura rugatobispora]
MVAPLAAAIATGTAATATVPAAATPAVPGAAEAGPQAFLSRDAAKGSLPAEVADAAHPLVRIPATAANDVLTAQPGLASVNPKGAASRLGPGTLRTAQGEMRFTGMTASCEKDLDGLVRGFTRINPDATLNRALGKVPARPAKNHRVPAPKGRTVTLNKQLRDATGALTVVGAAVTEPNGVTRDYAVARCPAGIRTNGAGLGKPTRAKAGERRAPDPDRDGLLFNGGERTLRDLINMAQMGALAGLPSSVPRSGPRSGPRSNASPADTPEVLTQDTVADAPQGPAQDTAANVPNAPAANAPQGPEAPAAGAPKAPKKPKTSKKPKTTKSTKSKKPKTTKKSKKSRAGQSAGAPRPATGNASKTAKRLVSAPLPGDLRSTVTGMPGQVAGPATPSTGAILGGAPGLPMVG